MISIENISSIFMRCGDESVDVTDLVISIEIYQSLYSPFVTGTITLQDSPSSRLSKQITGSIVGKGEELLFSIKTKTFAASRTNELDFEKYYIYKITNIPLENVGESMFKQNILLNFCSKTMFLDSFKNVGGFFYDTISNIVKTISKTYLDIDLVDIEPTEEKQFVIMPYLHPIQSIQWLTTRAYSFDKTPQKDLLSIQKKSDIKKKNNNFVFYEDIDHQHHFVSMGLLMSKPSVLGTNEDSGIRMETGGTKGLIDSEDLKYKGSFAGLQHIGRTISPLKNAKIGMYSSTCLTFDITRKKYGKTNMNYSDLFTNQTHFYNRQLVDPELDPKDVMLNMSYDNPNMVIKYYPKSTYLYTEKENPLQGNNPANSVDKWLLPRIASMEAMDQNGIDVELVGNVGLSLGDVINFSRPQLDSSPYLPGRDPFFTGKFLITKIKHMLENKGNFLGFNLRTSLSLARDSEYSETPENESSTGFGGII